jgi:hypothetical protein
VTTDLDLMLTYPSLPWGEPVKVSTPDVTRYCCRLCIARCGLKAQDVATAGFQTAADCAEHIAREHPDTR